MVILDAAEKLTLLSEAVNISSRHFLLGSEILHDGQDNSSILISGGVIDTLSDTLNLSYTSFLEIGSANTKISMTNSDTNISASALSISADEALLLLGEQVNIATGSSNLTLSTSNTSLSADKILLSGVDLMLTSSDSFNINASSLRVGAQSLDLHTDQALLIETEDQGTFSAKELSLLAENSSLLLANNGSFLQTSMLFFDAQDVQIMASSGLSLYNEEQFIQISNDSLLLGNDISHMSISGEGLQLSTNQTLQMNGPKGIILQDSPNSSEIRVLPLDLSLSSHGNISVSAQTALIQADQEVVLIPGVDSQHRLVINTTLMDANFGSVHVKGENHVQLASDNGISLLSGESSMQIGSEGLMIESESASLRFRKKLGISSGDVVQFWTTQNATCLTLSEQSFDISISGTDPEIKEKSAFLHLSNQGSSKISAAQSLDLEASGTVLSLHNGTVRLEGSTLELIFPNEDTSNTTSHNLKFNRTHSAWGGQEALIMPSRQLLMTTDRQVASITLEDTAGSNLIRGNSVLVEGKDILNLQSTREINISTSSNFMGLSQAGINLVSDSLDVSFNKAVFEASPGKEGTGSGTSLAVSADKLGIESSSLEFIGKEMAHFVSDGAIKLESSGSKMLVHDSEAIVVGNKTRFVGNASLTLTSGENEQSSFSMVGSRTNLHSDVFEVESANAQIASSEISLLSQESQFKMFGSGLELNSSLGIMISGSAGVLIDGSEQISLKRNNGSQMLLDSEHLGLQHPKMVNFTSSAISFESEHQLILTANSSSVNMGDEHLLVASPSIDFEASYATFLKAPSITQSTGASSRIVFNESGLSATIDSIVLQVDHSIELRGSNITFETSEVQLAVNNSEVTMNMPRLQAFGEMISITSNNSLGLHVGEGKSDVNCSLDKISISTQHLDLGAEDEIKMMSGNLSLSAKESTFLESRHLNATTESFDLNSTTVTAHAIQNFSLSSTSQLSLQSELLDVISDKVTFQAQSNITLDTLGSLDLHNGNSTMMMQKESISFHSPNFTTHSDSDMSLQALTGTIELAGRSVQIESSSMELRFQEDFELASDSGTIHLSNGPLNSMKMEQGVFHLETFNGSILSSEDFGINANGSILVKSSGSEFLVQDDQVQLKSRNTTISSSDINLVTNESLKMFTKNNEVLLNDKIFLVSVRHPAPEIDAKDKPIESRSSKFGLDTNLEIETQSMYLNASEDIIQEAASFAWEAKNDLQSSSFSLSPHQLSINSSAFHISTLESFMLQSNASQLFFNDSVCSLQANEATIDSNQFRLSSGNITLESQAYFSFSANESLTFTSNQGTQIKSDGPLELSSQNALDFHSNSGSIIIDDQTTKIEAGSQIVISSNDVLNLTAPSILLGGENSTAIVSETGTLKMEAEEVALAAQLFNASCSDSSFTMDADQIAWSAQSLKATTQDVLFNATNEVQMTAALLHQSTSGGSLLLNESGVEINGSDIMFSTESSLAMIVKNSLVLKQNNVELSLSEDGLDVRAIKSQDTSTSSTSASEDGIQMPTQNFVAEGFDTVKIQSLSGSHLTLLPDKNMLLESNELFLTLEDRIIINAAKGLTLHNEPDQVLFDINENEASMKSTLLEFLGEQNIQMSSDKNLSISSQDSFIELLPQSIEIQGQNITMESSTDIIAKSNSMVSIQAASTGLNMTSNQISAVSESVLVNSKDVTLGADSSIKLNVAQGDVSISGSLLDVSINETFIISSNNFTAENKITEMTARQAMKLCVGSSCFTDANPKASEQGVLAISSNERIDLGADIVGLSADSSLSIMGGNVMRLETKSDGTIPASDDVVSDIYLAVEDRGAIGIGPVFSSRQAYQRPSELVRISNIASGRPMKKSPSDTVLAVESDGNSVITILSAAESNGSLNFASETNVPIGYIRMEHGAVSSPPGDSSMSLGISNDVIKVTGKGFVGIGNLAEGSDFQAPLHIQKGSFRSLTSTFVVSPTVALEASQNVLQFVGQASQKNVNSLLFSSEHDAGTGKPTHWAITQRGNLDGNSKDALIISSLEGSSPDLNDLAGATVGMSVNKQGHMGVGKLPDDSSRLTVQGDGVLRDVFLQPDTLKGNEIALFDALSKIQQMRIWSAQKDAKCHTCFGFNTQQILEEIPELGWRSTNGQRSLSVTALLVLLVGAVQEQARSVAELDRHSNEQALSLSLLDEELATTKSNATLAGQSIISNEERIKVLEAEDVQLNFKLGSGMKKQEDFEERLVQQSFNITRIQETFEKAKVVQESHENQLALNLEDISGIRKVLDTHDSENKAQQEKLLNLDEIQNGHGTSLSSMEKTMQQQEMVLEELSATTQKHEQQMKDHKSDIQDLKTWKEETDDKIKDLEKKLGSVTLLVEELQKELASQDSVIKLQAAKIQTLEQTVASLEDSSSQAVAAHYETEKGIADQQSKALEIQATLSIIENQANTTQVLHDQLKEDHLKLRQEVSLLTDSPEKFPTTPDEVYYLKKFSELEEKELQRLQEKGIAATEIPRKLEVSLDQRHKEAHEMVQRWRNALKAFRKIDSN